MGTQKKHARQSRRMQTRTKTRGKHHTPTSDPATNNALLSTQLHALGLYAVETLGDGNCLFRALSDQLYGTPSYHYKLRSEVCDWIQAHKERYEPFVEDDRGFDVHLSNMREHGTYGGHMELSAFAHLNRRNIKVIQPGLVYVIECDSADATTSKRESRRRVSKAKEADAEDIQDPAAGSGTLYIAYHDWEHFSSVRNISGPHQGLPAVVEAPAPTSCIRSPKNPITLRIPKRTTALPSSSLTAVPSSIALPRSVSPSSQGSSQLSSESSSSLDTPEDSTVSLHVPTMRRHSASPKRSLEESEADDTTESQPYSDKKHKSDRYSPFLDDDDPLSELSSVVSTSNPESESATPARAISPPYSTDDSVVPQREPAVKPLTRRQRKALGLPKPRELTAGKIIIPGGKHPQRQGKGWVLVSEDEEDAALALQRHEWVRNGSGRVDVRGFKELKI